MTRLHYDISQLGPEFLFHLVDVVDENGHRVGLRLARYEVLTRDDEVLYHLYGDPPVVVKVKPGSRLTLAVPYQSPPAIPATPQPQAAQAQHNPTMQPPPTAAHHAPHAAKPTQRPRSGGHR
jgi:hypothetical protein